MSKLIDRIASEDKRHEAVTQQLKSELSALISELPENPDIQRMTPRCFVVSSSALAGGRWGAETQDWKAQYRAIIGLLENVTLQNGVERIKSALCRESVRIKGDKGTSYTLNLHQDVISIVQQLLERV